MSLTAAAIIRAALEAAAHGRPTALVGCEYSGRVAGAFAARGWYAVSCDLEPAEWAGPHYQGDVRDLLAPGLWQLGVMHPPCTHLAVSGARHFAAKRADGRQQAALEFVRELLAAPIERIALENPVSIISSQVRKPDQVVQPWMFGHPETKATCLWLQNLPTLTETDNVHAQMMALPKAQRNRVHYMSPGPNRWKERSRTFQGLANAMAEQWGPLVEAQLARYAPADGWRSEVTA